MERFVEVCMRKGLNVNIGKEKVRVFCGDEGLESEFRLDEVRLEEMSEFKYLECVLGESGINFSNCPR